MLINLSGQEVVDELRRQGYEIVPLGTERRLAEMAVEQGRAQAREATLKTELEVAQEQLTKAKQLLEQNVPWMNVDQSLQRRDHIGADMGEHC